MEIFLDTANIEDIKKGAEMGVIDGVTTNPSLVAKEGKDFKQRIKDIAKIPQIQSVSAETVSLDAEGMIKEARILSKLSKKVVVKVPMTPEGLKAVKALKKEGIRCNVTLVFSANQALLAAKAGAYYVSPFVGRLDDIGHTGMELIAEIRDVFDNYGFDTKILAASLRHTDHAKQAALLGADIMTIPKKVLDGMFKHALTDNGIKKFLEDWNSIPAKLRKI
ncbi:MAG: fructose-6-phosphate aldolase [DPANN group archaeon]|nr:fructose-6-phosphate aldolase [DPANN group archaeon]